MKLSDITYLIVEDSLKRQNYIFFDSCEDLSVDNSSKITEDPVDAIKGSSLQDKVFIELTNLSISGSFSNRNLGNHYKLSEGLNVLFVGGNRRIESIMNWFENAIENITIFTVCKKGIIYQNQLLNSLKWSLDDSASKIGVSLSFIEIVNVERAEVKGSCSIIIPSLTPSNSGSKGSKEFVASDMYGESILK